MTDSLLPSNATDFERALEQVTRSDMSSPIRYLWDTENCPEALLYVLAITLDVDEWDESWSIEAKRKTLSDAFYVHSTKGTPESIRRVLRNAGYEEIDIIEGNEDSTDENAWATYVVNLQKPITNSQAAQVRRVLEETAPLHCECRELNFEFVQFTYNGLINYDGVYNFGAG